MYNFFLPVPMVINYDRPSSVVPYHPLSVSLMQFSRPFCPKP